MASCPLCRVRKGKRHCPAREALICAQCCGTKRQVEIACPHDCIFLTGGHAGNWAGRETERRRDVTRFAPSVQALSDDQERLFFLALAGIAAMRTARTDMNDRLLANALTAFRKTVETRERGLLYDHHPDDPRAEGVLNDLKQLFEARDEEGKVNSPSDTDLSAVINALEKAVDRVLGEGRGPTAFLDLAARVAAHLGVKPAPRNGPIILTP